MNYKLFLVLLSMSLFAMSCKKDKATENSNTHFNSRLSYGEVIDIDGNKYATIKIGSQIWMAENLRTSRYSNGDTIPNFSEFWQWYNLTYGGWAHYRNDPAFEKTCGKLYNWYAITDSANICPKGWHVSTDDDWTILLNDLGGNIFAGSKMKSKLNGAWALSYEGQNTKSFPNNESGFRL
jgi:uncharacterized protein (TIGR02145 family)